VYDDAGAKVSQLVRKVRRSDVERDRTNAGIGNRYGSAAGRENLDSSSPASARQIRAPKFPWPPITTIPHEDLCL
jgi:hypothetical protein